jgi:hypothetical protein
VPLDKYFKGKGEKVMANMQREYGEEKGKRVFYATANKRKGLRKGARKGAVNG